MRTRWLGLAGVAAVLLSVAASGRALAQAPTYVGAAAAFQASRVRAQTVPTASTPRLTLSSVPATAVTLSNGLRILILPQTIIIGTPSRGATVVATGPVFGRIMYSTTITFTR